MDDHVAENRDHWEEASSFHPETDAYDVAAFLDGASTLTPIEREEIGDVAGKRLCHLQCHFGLDTLSWAREGAAVTGLDFAAEGVDRARDLAEEAGLADRATFVRGNVFDAPAVLAAHPDVADHRFEVVFTSYGALVWLPDLDRWAEAVAAVTEPGGTVYLAEFHPLLSTLEFAFDGGRTGFPYPYFTPDEPLTWEGGGTYADEDAEMTHGTTHEWPHGVGEILTALLDAGLELEFVHEHPRTPWRQFDGMVQDADGLWYFEDVDLPLVLSVKAVRPASA